MRFGQQRPARGLGERSGGLRVGGVVANDHDAAGTRKIAEIRRRRGCHGGNLDPRASAGPSLEPRVDGRRREVERFAQRDVEVHGPLRRRLDRAADQRAPVGIGAGRLQRFGWGRADFGEQRDGATEQLDLIGRLAGARPAQLRRTIGRQHDDRQVRVRGFEDGGVQVRAGGSRRAHDDDGTATALRQSDRQESGAALVEAGVEALPSTRGGREQRAGERRGTRTGAHHDVIDAAPREFVCENHR